MKRSLISLFCAGAVVALLPPPGLASPVDCANIAPSAGLAPPQLLAECGGKTHEVLPRFDPTDMAMSPDAVVQACSQMILNNPVDIFDFGVVSDFLPACDFAGSDFTKLYCYTFDIPAILYSVDTMTCEEILIGFANNTGSQTISGMAWDFTTDTMYASSTDISTSQVHVADLAEGSTVFVGEMGADSPGNITIGMVGGQMYGYDIVNDSLQSINKMTGLATTVGPLGFDANFAQGMDFDESDGTCYMFAFNNISFAAELRTCDINTGSTTLVSTIGFGDRAWAGVGVMTAPPPGGCANPLYCFSFDLFCDGIEVCQVLGDRTVVATWRNLGCTSATAPMLGGYSGKNVSPRLAWLAGDPSANLATWNFNLNLDAETFDLFRHDTGGNLIQFYDDELYTLTPGACFFGPERERLPASTDVNR